MKCAIITASIALAVLVNIHDAVAQTKAGTTRRLPERRIRGATAMVTTGIESCRVQY